MVTVQPGQTVNQHADEVIVYELPLDVWGTGTSEDFTVTPFRPFGTPDLTATQAPPAHKVSRVSVSGGCVGGSYEVRRLVERAGPIEETRRRSFTVRII